MVSSVREMKFSCVAAFIHTRFRWRDVPTAVTYTALQRSVLLNTLLLQNTELNKTYIRSHTNSPRNRQLYYDLTADIYLSAFVPRRHSSANISELSIRLRHYRGHALSTPESRLTHVWSVNEQLLLMHVKLQLLLPLLLVFSLDTTTTNHQQSIHTWFV